MLTKTEKGRLELRPGHRSLGQRERALLLVADGQQSESQMASLFSGDGQRLIEQLLEQGYLERKASGRFRREPSPAAAAAPVTTQARPLLPSPPSAQPAAANAAAAVHGDSFSGPRSLASARMYLFDLSERLFAARDKELANRYRDALREARDPQAMIVIGRLMVADVEVIAGPERAQSIAERLHKLLPAEVLEQAA